MATEQQTSVTTETGSYAKWGSWLAALVGLWVIASPFVLSGAIDAGTPMYSTAFAGLVILVLAGASAFAVRSQAEYPTSSPGEIAGWIAAVAGLWILVSPFVLTGAIASGTPMWSTAVAGLVVLVLAGYAGYSIHGGP